MQKDQLKKILSEHSEWIYSNGKRGKRANLAGAILAGANLSGACLPRANLSGADLSGADLSDADLSGANLSGANLAGAILAGANLSGANLSGAILADAILADAILSRAGLAGATMPDGKKWEEYLSESVPALLKAGGKNLKDVATDEHWNCHNWDNCPMAAAFDVHDTSHIPEEYQKDAETFITLFDSRLIPKPEA